MTKTRIFAAAALLASISAVPAFATEYKLPSDTYMKAHSDKHVFTVWPGQDQQDGVELGKVETMGLRIAFVFTNGLGGDTKETVGRATNLVLARTQTAFPDKDVLVVVCVGGADHLCNGASSIYGVQIPENEILDAVGNPRFLSEISDQQGPDATKLHEFLGQATERLEKVVEKHGGLKAMQAEQHRDIPTGGIPWYAKLVIGLGLLGGAFFGWRWWQGRSSTPASGK